MKSFSFKLSLFLVLTFSFWIGKDLLQPGFLQSHDGLYHVVRLQQFHQSLTSGQLPVRWAPTLLNGLGYPLFIVNYTLPYYLSEIIYLLSGSFFTAIQLTLFLSLLAGALTSFLVFHSWTRDRFSAFVGSFLYTIAPYRLANIFERGALGETLAYVFVPLLFHRHLIALVIGLTGIILSHTVVAMIFIPIAFLYSPKKSFILATAIAMALSAFQLMPIIFERQFMQFDTNLLTYYQGHFRSLAQLLRLPLAGVNIGTRFQIGLIHSLIILIALTQRKRNIWFFIIISVISLFLITPASAAIWNAFPPLKFILYPWRWLGVVAFTSSAIAVLVIPKKHAFLIGFLLIISSLYAYRHYTKVDSFITARFPTEMLSGNATTQSEFDPIWMTEETLSQPITPQTKLYFPGWSKPPDAYGLISGQDLKFTETPIRLLGDWISLVTFITLIGYYAYHSYLNYRRSR